MRKRICVVYCTPRCSTTLLNPFFLLGKCIPRAHCTQAAFEGLVPTEAWREKAHASADVLNTESQSRPTAQPGARTHASAKLLPSFQTCIPYCAFLSRVQDAEKTEVPLCTQYPVRATVEREFLFAISASRTLRRSWGR